MDKAALLVRTKMIAEECSNDAARLDGTAVTGKELARIFGETLANIYALSRVVQEMLEDPDG